MRPRKVLTMPVGIALFEASGAIRTVCHRIAQAWDDASDTRPTERSLFVLGLVSGTFNCFLSGGYVSGWRYMEHVFPQQAWGVLMYVLAAFRFAGIYTGDLRIRLGTAYAAIFLTFGASCFVAWGFFRSLILILFAFALYENYSIVRNARPVAKVTGGP